MANNHHHHEGDADSIYDRGLAFDLATLMQRRRALKLFTGAAIGGASLAIVGCGDENKAATGSGSTATATSTGSAVATNTPGAAVSSGSASSSATALVSAIPTQATPASACTAEIPEETNGPYPSDGSNGPNVLTASGIVRSDIRSSFGTSTNTAKGVPLTIKLKLVDTSKNCAPLAGSALYAWHCDREGNYSMYSQAVTNENYLRGVQVADANGELAFQSIYPGCYSGRWPHVHFEVYPSLASASTSKNALVTSQLAFPEDICKLVYATDGYSQSVQNLSRITLKTDNVFSDGWTLQMATLSGNVTSGYTATLVVGV